MKAIILEQEKVKTRHILPNLWRLTNGYGWLIPLLLLIVWELASHMQWVESYQLPAPSTIGGTLYEWLLDGTLWTHGSMTTLRVLAGFFLGSIVAFIFGICNGLFPTVHQLTDPLIQGLRAIPSLAWVPLFVLWMGIGETSKVVLIAVGVFFPVYLSVVSGLQQVPKQWIEVGRLYQLSRLQLVRKILLPASLPSCFVGLRSGLGLGWMFVVAAELMGASEGLGYLLVMGQNTLSPDMIIASIVLFACIGKITDWILVFIQRRVYKGGSQWS